MSCQYNSTKLLNKDELKWLEVYSGKETLLYRSSMHEMDTIVISKKVDNKPRTLGFYYYTDFYGGAEFQCNIRHNGKNIPLSFFMIKNFDDSTKLSIRMNNSFVSGILPKKITDEIEIDGMIYDDIIVIKDTSWCESSKSPYNCIHMVWSKSKGLIQYTYCNGETFTFYKNCNTNSQATHNPQ